MRLEPAPTKEEIFPNDFGMSAGWLKWFARLFDFSRSPSFPNLPTHADNAAAVAAGLEAGTIYKTATGVVMCVY